MKAWIKWVGTAIVALMVLTVPAGLVFAGQEGHGTAPAAGVIEGVGAAHSEPAGRRCATGV